MSEAENPPADDVVVVDHDEAGRVEWRFERAFFASGWECLWGRGCRGILDDDATELEQGCCSLGAELADEDDGLVAASAALLGRDRGPVPRSGRAVPFATSDATTPRSSTEPACSSIGRGSPVVPAARCTWRPNAAANPFWTGSRRCAGRFRLEVLEHGPMATRR
ncbi:MAG: hypothetical protein R2705_15915 [Ilumatobacteraceae bacterium]